MKNYILFKHSFNYNIFPAIYLYSHTQSELNDESGMPINFIIDVCSEICLCVCVCV